MNDIFEQVLSHIRGRQIARENDYMGKDGLLYCGKCNKPREKWVEFSNGKDIVRLNCDCDEELFQREKKEEKMQQRIIEIKDTLSLLYEMGAAYEPVANLSFNDMKSEKNTKQIINFINHFDEAYDNNAGLLLYGAMGTGKTFFVECIANELINKGRFAWLTSVRAIVNALNGNHGANRPYLMNLIGLVDLLILDDFGTERDTEYMNEQLYEVINARYRAKRPVVLTTNLSPSQMANETDIRYKRIYERILGMCTPLLIEGTTRRKGEAVERLDFMKTILNE